jgi:hypothetical protein
MQSEQHTCAACFRLIMRVRNCQQRGGLLVKKRKQPAAEWVRTALQVRCRPFWFLFALLCKAHLASLPAAV